MKQVNGVWLPDEEVEIAKFVRGSTVDGVGVYQYGKLTAALAFVRQWRTALDVGAHCGTWAMQLAKRFATVHAFEPVERHCECFLKNAPRAILHRCALGSGSGTVRLAKGVKSTGDTCVAEAGEYEAELCALDSFNLSDVDFVKIDCEGYELFVLQGGEQTILRDRPVIIVEQKPGKARTYGLDDTEAVSWLLVRDYRLRGEISGDYILTPA